MDIWMCKWKRHHPSSCFHEQKLCDVLVFNHAGGYIQGGPVCADFFIENKSPRDLIKRIGTAKNILLDYLKHNDKEFLIYNPRVDYENAIDGLKEKIHAEIPLVGEYMVHLLA